VFCRPDLVERGGLVVGYIVLALVTVAACAVGAWVGRRLDEE